MLREDQDVRQVFVADYLVSSKIVFELQCEILLQYFSNFPAITREPRCSFCDCVMHFAPRPAESLAMASGKGEHYIECISQIFELNFWFA